MMAEQMLEKYISEHPDYWEFENEIKEIERIEELCSNEAIKLIIEINVSEIEKLGTTPE
jgi:hypothetical protein